MEKLITVKDVAEMLNVTMNTVNRWCQRGIIPFYRLGHRSPRFDPNEIQEWLAKRKEGKILRNL